MTVLSLQPGANCLHIQKTGSPGNGIQAAHKIALYGKQILMTHRQHADGKNPSGKRQKFSRQHLLNAKKLRKGKTRWNQFAEILDRTGRPHSGRPLLDFGCGVGYFVHEGLLRGEKIWGVDASESKIARFHKLIHFSNSPAQWEKKCLVGNGEALPFRTAQFAAVCSWYVLEHLENPGAVIRDLVRITAPSGLIVLRAQDARNGWEGHCQIPWIPFLSGRLAAAWMEAFDVEAGKRVGVFDITQPQVITILETLGCEIVSKAPEPQILIDRHWELHDEAAVRRTARRVKAMLADGTWQPQSENLYLVARTPSRP
jgi:ubiquinone/menaquinone biosynthesis C-methylase UbiE